MGGLVGFLSVAVVFDVILGASVNSSGTQVLCGVIAAILSVAIICCCVAIKEMDERSRREREWDRTHRR